MADFATDDPRKVLKDREAAKALAQALKDGKVPESKRYEAEQALLEFRSRENPETGKDPVPREVDGTPRVEFWDGVGISIDPQQEFGRQMLSASKGLGNMGFNMALFALDAANAVGADGGDFEGFINKQRRAMMDRRAQFNADANNMIIEVMGAEPSGFGEFLGTTLPFFAIPSALSTYVRTVAYNGLVGAVGGGALTPDAENFQDRVGDMGVGTLFGLGTSAVLSAKSGFQNYASRRIQKRFESDLARANKELEKELQAMVGSDFNFSMGQISADPFITGLEYGAAHKLQRTAQNARIQKLVEFLDARSAALSRGGDAEKIAVDLHKTMERLSDETLTAAGQQYSRGIDDLVENYGDQIVLGQVHARGYLDKARELAGELADPRHLGTPGMVPKGLKDHIDFLDIKLNPFRSVRRIVEDGNGKRRVVYDVTHRESGEVLETFSGRGAAKKALTRTEAENLSQGGLNVEDVAEVLKGNRRLAAGDTPLFENLQLGSTQNLAAALKGALLESIEGSSSQAITRLQNIRSEYAKEMLKLNSISNTMLGRIFGDESAVFSADEALDRLIGRSPQSLRATREILEEWNPGLLDDIKSVTIRRAVERSRNPAEVASLLDTDLTLLANNLAGKSKGVGELGTGLFTPREQSEILAVAKAVRVLKETYVDSFSFASASATSDFTINVVSRSPEFMARFLTRTLGQSEGLSAALNDPGARQAILRLASSGPNNDKGRMALAYLAVLHGETEKERAEEERKARLEEAGRTGLDPFRE